MVEYKVCFLGDGGVGKTAVIQKLLVGTFEPKYDPTLGVEVQPLDFNKDWTNNQKVKFNVWDFAGQEKFYGNQIDYLTGCNFFVIFYDITSKISYEHAMNYWLKVVKDHVKKPKIVFASTKHDIPKEQHKMKDLGCIRTSAKSGENLEEIFKELLQK